MAHWRDTYRPARFFILDARAGVPLLVCLLHVSTWTIGFAAAVMVLFWWLERIGMDAASAARALRAWFAGRHRPGKPPFKTRGRIDYDRRP